MLEKTVDNHTHSYVLEQFPSLHAEGVQVLDELYFYDSIMGSDYLFAICDRH